EILSVWPPGYEESVSLVNLREVNGDVMDSLGEWIPARGNGGLHDVNFAVPKHFILVSLRRFLEVSRIQAFVFLEPSCDCGNQWTIEQRMAIDHDAQLFRRHAHILSGMVPLDDVMLPYPAFASSFRIACFSSCISRRNSWSFL